MLGSKGVDTAREPSACGLAFGGGCAETLLVRGADVGEGGRLVDCSLAGPSLLSGEGEGSTELLLSPGLVLGKMGDMGVSILSES